MKQERFADPAFFPQYQNLMSMLQIQCDTDSLS